MINYSELAAKAESEAAAVKDPELRKIAFERILAALMIGATGPANAVRKTKATAAKARPEPTAKKVSKGPMAYIQAMVSDGYFAAQREIGAVKDELGNRGHHIPRTSLSAPLQRLTQMKVLRRHKQAGARGKQTFVYSNY